MSKLKKYLPVFVVAAFLLTGCAAKITDPSDPRFDIKQFQFEDYSDGIHYLKDFKNMFPPGTDKSYVDAALVTKGGATSEAETGKKNVIRYNYIKNSLLTRLVVLVRVQYNDNNKVIKVESDKGIVAP